VVGKFLQHYPPSKSKTTPSLTFTGELPAGSYGAGQVYRWDIGTFEITGSDDDALASWRKGSIRFRLHGKRLRGEWRLFKMKGRMERGKPLWLLQKIADEYSLPGHTAEIVGGEARN
jgi:bifunctional non-homologous end joining protein LigD